MNKRLEVGLLIGRIILGVIMLAHGVQKLMMMDNTVQMFDAIGLPNFMAYLTALIEAGAGITLILGLFVVPSAALLGLTMVAAIVLVKFKAGLVEGYDFPLSLLGLAAILTFTNSRLLAVSSLFNRNQH